MHFLFTTVKGNRKCLPLLLAFVWLSNHTQAQDLLHAQQGATITVQSGASVVVLGGVQLDNGSSLLNNGVIQLKQNGVNGTADWTDHSTTRYAYGSGKLVLNGTGGHTLRSPNTFGSIEVDAPGHVDLGSDIIATSWYLRNGRVNTSDFKAIARGTAALAVEADAANPDFTQSWFNGHLRRYVNPASVNSYTFPVGSSRHANRAVMENLRQHPLDNISYIDAYFSGMTGKEERLMVPENGQAYTALTPGGTWFLVPDRTPASGKYDLLLYFDGFNGLTDNSFGILNRPGAAATASGWTVPEGSVLPANNQPGRLQASGFARRNAISSFSQFGIGTTSAVHPFYVDARRITQTPVKTMKGTGGATVSVLLYPNPNRGQFSIRLDGVNSPVDAVITDMNGKTVRQLRLTSNNDISISGLSAGTYLIRIPEIVENGESLSEKVLVIK